MDHSARVLLISLSACMCAGAYESMRIYREPGTEHRLLRDTGMTHRLVRDASVDHRLLRDTAVSQRLVREGAYVADGRRSPRPTYSQDFLEDYEPYAYAAVPIHSPVPVLHVITPSTSPTKYRPKKFARPRPHPERDYTYSSSSSADQSYENSYSQEEFADSIPKPKYTAYYEEESPVLVYARPNKNGGYTYRRPTAPASAAGQKEPFVVRIHKYKLVRDTKK